MRARRASILPARKAYGRPSVHRVRETGKSADLRDKCARLSSPQRGAGGFTRSNKKCFRFLRGIARLDYRSGV